MGSQVKILDVVRGKRVHFFVAHHDDESLFFGGLLTEITTICNIKITVLTAPAANRPDTHTRQKSFSKVCDILGCSSSMYLVRDYHPNAQEGLVYRQLDDVVKVVRGELDNFCADVVFTHNAKGEPNPVYSSGHVVHRMVHNAVAKEKGNKVLFVCAIGLNQDGETVRYEITKKKALLDCYYPNWEPLRCGYYFAYQPETFRYE